MQLSKCWGTFYDNFGLLDSELSDDEGEVYAYLGEPISNLTEVKTLSRK